MTAQIISFSASPKAKGAAKKAAKPKARKAPKSRSVLQLKIELKHIKPLIWRRALVSSDIRLSKLHEVIQIAMGWTDSHLHEFEIHGLRFGPPSEENYGWRGMDALPENKHHLDTVLSQPDCPPAPYLMAGKNNCPPEDCGDPYGYMEFLQAMRDSTHPQHESTIEWFDGIYLDFDPDEINAILTVQCKSK